MKVAVFSFLHLVKCVVHQKDKPGEFGVRRLDAAFDDAKESVFSFTKSLAKQKRRQAAAVQIKAHG